MLNKKMLLNGLIMMAAVMAVSFPAFAASSGGGVPAGSLGGMINRILTNTSSLPDLVAFIAYMIGVLFVALGIHKLRQHSESGPQKIELPEPLKYLFVGGLMLALPSIANVAVATFGATGDAQEISWDQSGSGGAGLDGMMVNFMSNIYGPVTSLLVFFCYLAGAILMLIAVHRFTKTAQQGAQGPTGMGTIATFVLAGVLFSLAPSVGTVTETLFGNRSSSMEVEFMALSSAAVGGGADHAANVLVSILAFLVIVGILSIIRGFFVLRGVAEGNQQMTMMSGVSHVIAGAILVNFGQFANIIQYTLGITGYGVLFQ